MVKRVGCAETPRNVVIIVFGYGVELTKGLMDYLGHVIKTYQQFKKDGAATTIIVTGGATALKSSPNETEAEVMKLHLERKGVSEEDIYLEETALTTLENIRCAFETIGHLQKIAVIAPPDKIIVFCAREKKPAVRVALNYYSFRERRWFEGETEVKDCPLPINSLPKGLLGGLVMWLWIIFPKLHEWHKQEKIERIKNL